MEDLLKKRHIKQKRVFYGFRYFGNRNTTTGEPNARTGRCNIAGELVVFNTLKERKEWLAKEKLTAPCGSGGGERIPVRLSFARKLFGSLTDLKFEEMIDLLKWEKFNDV